ncbi:MAG: hypothetical protein HY518_04030 [Candidatus Aenigmarchaeota archaeon]|nr:hypothetical protein [Candidatus Aenigmarchaeota archaeon]
MTTRVNMEHTKEIKTVHQFGRYELIGPVKLPLKIFKEKVSEFSIWYFAFPGGQYAALIKGNPSKVKKPLVRVESVCIWAHFFGSQYCDCGWQLEEAKRLIDEEGDGLIIFAFEQHGKAVGLRNHFIVYAEGQLRCHELVVDAYTSLGFDEDYRKHYGDVADILRHFELKSIRLMSNNPKRIALLKKAGIFVERVHHEVPLDPYNKIEMISKKVKLGHLLSLKKKGGQNDKTRCNKNRAGRLQQREV